MVVVLVVNLCTFLFRTMKHIKHIELFVMATITTTTTSILLSSAVVVHWLPSLELESVLMQPRGLLKAPYPGKMHQLSFVLALLVADRPELQGIPAMVLMMT